MWGKTDAELVREQDGGKKRNQDAGEAGAERARALAAKLSIVKLHADSEQEKHETDGGKLFHGDQGSFRKQMEAGRRPHASEHRGTEQDAADNFAHHARLSEPGREGAAGQGDEHDDRNLKEQKRYRGCLQTLKISQWCLSVCITWLCVPRAVQ